MSDNNSTSPLDVPPPGVDMLEFYMNRAYARAAPATATELVTPGLNYDEKLKLMLLTAESEAYIHHAQAQLTRPCILSPKLTPLEQCEADRAEAKQYGDNLAKKINDHKLSHNEHLCEEVLVLIDEAEPRKPIDFQSRIPVRAQTISTPSPRPSQIPRLVNLEGCSPAFSKGKNFFAGLDKSRKCRRSFLAVAL